ncbi:hypothetical protein AJ87_49385 [Rhizobium yanglingense]|nr:hypothetical protein AJ87_49385 [Rhizobium yanglingense]
MKDTMIGVDLAKNVFVLCDIFFWSERKAWPGIEGWSGRHPQATDHRRDDPRELGKPQTACTRHLVGADAGEEAEDAGGDRPGEQEGAHGLGDADSAGRLSKSGAGCGGVTRSQPRTANVGNEV